MLHVIHGDDTVSSQNKVQELLKSLKNTVVLNGEKVSGRDIESAFTSQDLFVVEKCVVVEKFLKLKKVDMEALHASIEKKDKQVVVVLWHNTELSKLALSKFREAQVYLYMLPKLFFTFLDNITPKNYKQELDVLSKMEGIEAEQLFYSLVKRIRQLLYVSLSIQSEEVIKISPWQLSKLQDQASRWKAEDLKKLYLHLYDIEVSMKSGGLVLPLRRELDRVLIQELH